LENTPLEGLTNYKRSDIVKNNKVEVILHGRKEMEKA